MLKWQDSFFTPLAFLTHTHAGTHTHTHVNSQAALSLPLSAEDVNSGLFEESVQKQPGDFILAHTHMKSSKADVMLCELKQGLSRTCQSTTLNQAENLFGSRRWPIPAINTGGKVHGQVACPLQC